MGHVRGKPLHPQTQGKNRKVSQDNEKRILVKLDHYYHPDELTEALNKFVENYNNCRCHEALNNLTPSGSYFGRADKILEQRAIIKQQTIAKIVLSRKNNKFINQTLSYF